MLSILAAMSASADAQTPGNRTLLEGPGNPNTSVRNLRGGINPDPFARDRDQDDATADAERLGRRGTGDTLSQSDRQRGLDRDAARDSQSADQDRDTAERRAREDGERRGRPDAQGLAGDERDTGLSGTQQALDQEALVEEIDDSDPAAPGPYDPLGVRMGSFLLYPEVSIEGLYSDNALLSTTDSRSDRAVVITPQITARSTWSRHLLEGTVRGINSYYSEFPTLDDDEFSANLRGRIDISRKTSIEITSDYVDSQEDVDATDAPTGAAERTQTRELSGTAELSHRFNRLTATLRGGIAEEDFDDVRLVSGAIANNDDRDVTERELVGRLSYELRPGVDAFVEGSGNVHDFDSPFDDNGIRNGSSGYTVTGGISLELSGKLNGEIGAGFARQTPDEQSLEDISGLILNAALEWLPSALTTVRFDAETQVAETTQIDSAGSLIRTAVVSVEHAFRQNMIAGMALGYELEEFSGSGVEDEEYTLGLSGEYRLNRAVALIANYQFTKSTSSEPNEDYVENEFRLGMRLRR